ncbi:MAG: RsmE family RNA methyltransferase [Candidatus Omnitrophica bacterium]|nr:RsmE family RNA methyltransferase [Candidatus Omnitrophota bacterium]
MRRFLSSSKNISGTNISILDKNQVHHIKDVLRLKVDDAAIVFDEQGNEYICLIEELQRDKVILKIRGKNQAPGDTGRLRITVACAIPKHSRMDDIVDKLTQLGVERIIPLETERGVIRLEKEKGNLRSLRWQRISQAAAKQCQRNNVTIIEPVKNIKDVLRSCEGHDLKLIATLEGERESLRRVFLKSMPSNILVLVGPEGDFTHAEIKLAKAAGCEAISLGNLVLRVETAAIAIASFIRLYEDH